MAHPVARWVTAMGVGMAVAWLLDPTSGNRRRALVRDKAGRAARQTADAARATSRDMRNRLSGAAASAKQMFRRADVDDAVLKERARARLGRYVSHPGAVDVRVESGTITVSGPILRQEADRLLKALRRVRGVAAVDDQLSRHDEANDIPALQGGVTRSGPRGSFRQASWSPTSRAVAGAAAVATVAAITAMYGVRHREPEAELYVLDIIP